MAEVAEIGGHVLVTCPLISASQRRILCKLGSFRSSTYYSALIVDLITDCHCEGAPSDCGNLLESSIIAIVVDLIFSVSKRLLRCTRNDKLLYWIF